MASKDNKYDKSVPIEVDWTSYDPQLTRAAYTARKLLNLNGHERNIIKHLKAIIVLLLRADKYYPDHYIAYTRDNNKSIVKSHKNPFELSTRTTGQIITAMQVKGWLEHKKGIYYPKRKSRSRFKAAARFELFKEMMQLDRLILHQEIINEGIILKDTDKNIIPYEDTDNILLMKKLLHRYNKLILNTDITLPTGLNDNVWLDRKISYRIFNNGSFEQGGRLYGAWWTRCSSDTRKQILINGEPTIELDYNAIHLKLIYLQANKQIPKNLESDPYNLSEEIDRSILKLTFVIAINSSDFQSGHKAFVKKIHGEDKFSFYCHKTKATHYKEAIDVLVDAHPILRPLLNAGHGTHLMHQESVIAMNVLTELRRKKIASLCIHDSFIVQERYKQELEEVMLLLLNKEEDT